MSRKIEDYALIGDRRSAALVHREGSIDWLCWPRFDSEACFAALLGDERHGHWQLGPRTGSATTRRYRPDTLILETRHVVPSGAVQVIDLMPVATPHPIIIRQVVGERGDVEMGLDLRLAFDYGNVVPWLQASPGRVKAVQGPHAVTLRSDAKLVLGDGRVTANFRVKAGQVATFTLHYGLSHDTEPGSVDAKALIAETDRYWTEWSGRFTRRLPWRDAVMRSLITLQAMTHATTGGIVAAPTSSLPEIPGGAANWDYRYSWVRDSTFALTAFLNAGYREEATAWRDWLLRAVAGDPAHLRTVYRCDGGRHIEPWEISWLPGYEGARPVRVGNKAASQRQLDIYGELIDCLYLAKKAALAKNEPWHMTVARSVADYIETHWREPDQGIWESRGSAQNFTYSKVMAWVGLDRFLKLRGPVRLEAGRRAALEAVRDKIHREICARSFSVERNSFTAAYGSDRLDANLLLLPLVGFLPMSDPRMSGTVDAIERELVVDGLVRRWPRNKAPREGAFLACSCWLADCLAMRGDKAKARAYLERVLATRNDVGLLSEEWDPRTGRMMGNFPQVLSHLAVINTALGLSGPVLQRAGG